MGIRRSTAGRHRRHRRPARAIVPALLLALGAGGAALTGVVPTATPAVAMHFHGHKVTSLPMMHFHG